MDAQRVIARRMILGLPPEGLSPIWERDFAAYPPAGVIVFARDFTDLDALRRLTTRLRELARPRRVFIAMDEEGGHVSQLGAHLIVPPNAMLIARGAAPGDLEWLARVTGSRLRALGVDWVLAPVADIHSTPENPVIGARSLGTDAEQVAAAVAETLRGHRAAGIASCLKHFPGHGDTTTDSHVARPVSAGSAASLEARELLPFRANLDAGAIMTAHVSYPALDADRPATLSRVILHDLLRGVLGFTGITVTDALEMKGAGAGSAADTARQALAAGCDLLLFAFHDQEVRRVRLELAKDLTEGRMDRASFDAGRPRLAAFDLAHAEPEPRELESALDSLTPPDWGARIEAIIERGLMVRGELPAGAATGDWKLEQAGPRSMSAVDADLAARGIAVSVAEDLPLHSELTTAGVPLASGDAASATARVLVVRSRAPLAAGALDRLRADCRTLPTVLVGLQNDGFLEQVPEAAVRISAADATPLTRAVVARRIAQLRARA
jgi:beta-glucosidase-like glycosyl hydrolase